MILGINSFLGSYFLKNLIEEKDYYFYGTYNKSTFRIKKYLSKFKKNFFKINMNNKNKKLINIFKKTKPDIIINFIGYSDPKTINEKNSLINFIKNISFSLKLSNIKIEHFYNIGSCEEYYGSTSKLKESSKLANTTLYSIYKISIHKFLLNFLKNNHINYTNLRTFNVIGKDRYKENVITYINSNIASKKLNFYNIYAVRDFMWIDDYINILKLILKKQNNYKVINIGSGEATPILKILNYISKKKKIKINHRIIYKNKIKNSKDIKVANIDRIKKIIKSYKFVKINEIIDRLI